MSHISGTEHYRVDQQRADPLELELGAVGIGSGSGKADRWPVDIGQPQRSGQRYGQGDGEGGHATFQHRASVQIHPVGDFVYVQ